MRAPVFGVTNFNVLGKFDWTERAMLSQGLDIHKVVLDSQIRQVQFGGVGPSISKYKIVFFRASGVRMAFNAESVMSMAFLQIP